MIDKSSHTSNFSTAVYILLVAVAAGLGFGYSARTKGLFACQAPTPGNNQYIGICNVAHFGDYDHGAFWFGLEDTAIEAATEATVLFLGNSRMQFALSTEALENWFSARDISFYLLGFSHHENVLFVEPLLAKLQPKATFHIINVDNFFKAKLTGPANAVMNEPDSLNRYEQKQFWQQPHQYICSAAGLLCGNAPSFIRARDTGVWEFKGADFLANVDYSDQPIVISDQVDTAALPDYEVRAKRFLDSVAAVPGCVVLTNVPNDDTSAGTATALAQRLGLPLVAPEMEGLTTFDGSHLDPASASRWSRVFIDRLAPHINRCVQGQG